MNPFLIVVLAIVAIFLLLQGWMLLKSKKSVGKPIPFENIENIIAEQIKDKKGILYFHSPSCHNCKNQSPIIEKIAKDNESIISIDASKNRETARSLNVMGTPSIIFFSGNKITGYYVGVKSESFILDKLKTI